MDPDLKKHLESHASITFRSGRNLRDRLNNNHFIPPQAGNTWLTSQPKGNFKCSGCIACPFIKTCTSFTSYTTKHTFTVHSFLNCRSSNIIYLMSCSCGTQYVGKTTREFRWRLGEHLGDVRHQRDTAVSHHMHGSTMVVIPPICISK